MTNRRILAIILASAATTPAAYAQQVAPQTDVPSVPAPQSSGDNQAPQEQAGTGLATDDIIVTARRRSESLSKVPVSVSAFSGDQLEEAGIRTPLDLARDTPSLRVGQSLQASDSAIFTLRGLTAGEIQLTVDQPVGVYVDGVNYPRVYGLSAGFVDLERVEVLKGPQGTLYGKNTTGGAINVISKNADYDGTHGYIFGEFGNYESRRINGAINTVLVQDSLAFRFAFQNWTRNGYGSSRITGQDLGGDKNQTFIRGSLLWQPNSDLTINLKADALRTRENGYLGTGRFYAPVTSTDQQVAIDLGLDPRAPESLVQARAAIQNIVNLGSNDFFTADFEDLLFNNLNHHAVGLTVTYKFSPNVQLKSITGYRHLDSDRQIDLDGTRFNIITYGADSPGPFFYPHYDLTRDNLFTQEANLSGDLAGGAIEWMFGGFYAYEKGDDSSTNDLRAGQLRVIANNPYTINQTRVVDIFSESWAVFTQNSWRVTDELTLTGGLRYSHERKGLTQQNSRYAPSTGLYQCNTTSTAIVTDTSQCSVTRSVSFDGFSWLASASWRVTPDVMVYAKASRGFKGGGFDTRPIAPAFQPETAQDYELGLKGLFLDRRLRTNLAIYRTSYTNKQENQIVPVGNLAVSLTRNAASAIIKGFEGDFTAQITDAFSIGGSLTYLDGRYKSFPTALNAASQVVDASGERFPNPRWAYSANMRYTLPLPNGRLGFIADWAWTQGLRPTPRLIDQGLPTALVDELVRQNVGLLNLRLDYEVESAGLTISLYATNALNKKYQTIGSTRLGTGGLQLGITQEPRMYGISFRKTFGNE